MSEDTIQNPDAELGRRIQAYCTKFSIPIDCFLDILNDTKVIPMLRGKGTEYNAYLFLQELLPQTTWIVNKLNLGPTPGTLDQDISILHRRTGIEITVETKNAVRGSITAATKTRLHRGIPHFKVKCHRSRSNTQNVNNDRYVVEDFNLIVTNPSNALFKGGTIGEEFELVDDPATVAELMRYYGVNAELDLIHKTDRDWRFVFSEDIANAGVIPRTPYVYLENDPNWFSPDQLEAKLVEWVRTKDQERRRARH